MSQTLPEPSSNEEVAYGFRARDVKRLSAVTNYVERYYRNTRQPARGRFPTLGAGTTVPAFAQSAVAGGSIAHPTKFTATLLVTDDSTGAADGALVAGGTGVDAYNHYTGTIAANSLIYLTPFGGKWRVVGANC